MSHPGPPHPSVAVLVVCTGNICRSPMAERMGRSMLDGALGAGAAAVRLHSAGVRAVVDSGMHPDSARALRPYGTDAGDFAARRLQLSMVVEADLILTMTEDHRRQVLETSPRALGRTFTLLEAASLLDLADDRTAPGVEDPTQRVRTWVRSLAAARSRRRGGLDDDVRDPVGLPFEAHEQAAADISAALDPLMRRLAHLVQKDTGPYPTGGDAASR